MALVFLWFIVCIAFKIFVVHAEESPPIQSDAHEYLNCLQSNAEQLTCDVTTFLGDITDLILQTISEENVECDENGSLDHALRAYFHGINFEDFEEGSLRVVSELMSQCLEHHAYQDQDFVDALSSFTDTLKAESIQSNSIPSDDQKATNLRSERYKRTDANNSDQLTGRESEPMNTYKPNKPNSSFSTAPNSKSQRQERYRASEPTNSVYSLFASSFFENVSTSKALQRLFNTIMMTNSAGNNFYNAFYRASKRFGLPTPGLFASTVAEAIGETFHLLSSCSFANIIASSVGQYLYNSEVLGRDNYSSLAAHLANDLNDSLNNIPIGSRDVFLTQSLANGIVRFLYSLGLFTPRDAPLFAKYLANELLFSRDNESLCRYKGTAELPSEDAYRKPQPRSQNKDFNKGKNQRFSSTLLQQLTASDRYSEFFNLQLSAEEASEASYDYIYRLASSLDLSYSNDIANEIAEAITSSLHSSRWYSFASVVVISLEKFLSAHSFLTADNTELLAEAYLDELNEVILSLPSSSYIDVFLKATYRFVVNHFVLDTERTNSFGTLLINELKSTGIHDPPVSSSADVKKSAAAKKHFTSAEKNFTAAEKKSRATEKNSTTAMILKNNFPEIYSPSGLSSEKASTRVKDLAKDLTLTFSPDSGINVDSFTKLFLSTLSEVSSDNPDLDTEGVLLQTLLEMISASLGIIQNSKFLAVPENSKMNLVLLNALSGII